MADAVAAVGGGAAWAPPWNQAAGWWFNWGRNTSLTEPCRVPCSINGALGEYRRGVDTARV